MRGRGRSRGEFKLFSDELYLVRAYSSGFVVWCSDENIVTANEDVGFEKAREIAREGDRKG